MLKKEIIANGKVYKRPNRIYSNKSAASKASKSLKASRWEIIIRGNKSDGYAIYKRPSKRIYDTRKPSPSDRRLGKKKIIVEKKLRRNVYVTGQGIPYCYINGKAVYLDEGHSGSNTYYVRAR